jgi:biopolymer transport protein ExbB
MTDTGITPMQLAQAQPSSPPPAAEPPSAPAPASETVSPPAAPPPEAVTQSVPVPADPPAVDGGASASVLDTVSGFVDLGGPVVALLLLLSVFALTIILLKLWQFSRDGQIRRNGVAAAVDQWLRQDYEAAMDKIRSLTGPVARVVAFAMRASAARRNEAHVREETELLALSEISSLRSYLRALEAVVQVAPLLGLFGTVLGMIEAFRTLEAAGSQVNPADLAGGIWVALLTTAVGLAVAMPVALVLHWFEGRIERVRQAIELFATEVMTHPPARKIETGGGEPGSLRLAAAAGADRAA